MALYKDVGMWHGGVKGYSCLVIGCICFGSAKTSFGFFPPRSLFRSYEVPAHESRATTPHKYTLLLSCICSAISLLTDIYCFILNL